MMQPRRIELSGKLSEVARLNDWLDAELAGKWQGSALAYDVKLCLNEVVTNIISYGFPSTPVPEIGIELTLGEQGARIVIEDNGAYFDLREWPDPPKPADLDSVRVGGFGIGLIKERASEIAYEKAGSRNRLTLVCGRLEISSSG